MSIRSNGWLSFSVFLIILLGTGLQAESQAPLKKPAKTADPFKPNRQMLEKSKKEWAVIDGFRSSRFGMSEQEVIRAITKDFNISKNKVDRRILSAQKVTALIIHTPKLMQVGGPADIVYFLEHKSNKLTRINIDWGKGVTDNVDDKDILSAANLLRNHFVKKRYKKEGYTFNNRLDKNNILVFRGRDKKDRTIILRLQNNKPKKEKNLSLILSYYIKGAK